MARIYTNIQIAKQDRNISDWKPEAPGISSVGMVGRNN